MRLKLTMGYEGTPFSGWQSQSDGNAVQDVIEKAFLRIIGKRVVLHGAGRTDAGVHALGQCAHADVPEGSMNLMDWRRALNANLPAEIRIFEVCQAQSDFHARFSASGKIYRYRIWNAEIMPPLECRRAWHVPGSLNFELLRSNAALFEGRHDFTAFSANRIRAKARRTVPEGDALRTIKRIQVTCSAPQEIQLMFEGEGFLYKMVRMLTGALVRVGQGKEVADWIPTLLGSPMEVKKNRYVAPAHGLYLVKVLYSKACIK